MRILVTGGAGFIGSQIVDAYVNAGHEVLVLDNLSTGVRAQVNPKAEFSEIDLNDAKLSQVVKSFQPEIINHHAAQIDVRKSVADPRFDAQTNILGFLNLMEAAKAADSVQKVIFASSGGAIYGEANTVPTDENYQAFPISPYGIAKLTTEYYLNYYHQVFNLPFVALRYANVYGPRQNPHGEAGVVAIFYQRIHDHQSFVINGPGKQTRDFVYVSDVVAANLKATDKPVQGIFNIGTGIETSINDLISIMKSYTTLDKDIAHGPEKAGEQQRSCLSNAKANRVLDWQPQVNLSTGLKTTAEFFGF
jgi:UDP-glucose 4-epimerase